MTVQINILIRYIKYIKKELQHGTLMGPYVTSPFPQQDTAISPLSTRPKRNTEQRRIIMDLSWPIDGPSVNSGIPTETYLENVILLKYVTVICYVGEL